MKGKEYRISGLWKSMQESSLFDFLRMTAKKLLKLRKAFIHISVVTGTWSVITESFLTIHFSTQVFSFKKINYEERGRSSPKSIC